MISSIPYTAPHEAVHAGLLNSSDWWTWLGYAFVLTLALFLMPGQLKESVGRLWGPVAAWIARLRFPSLSDGYFIAGSVLGLVRPFLCWDNWPEDEPEPDEDGIPYDVLWGTGPDRKGYTDGNG